MSVSSHARADPAWFKRMKTLGLPADPRRAVARAYLKEWSGYYWLALVALVFCAAQIRNWRKRRARFTVTYPGNHSVQVPLGLSVLEVSRRAGRPHVSVCGGRARCTTCRIRIEETAEELPPPNDLEAAALVRRATQTPYSGASPIRRVCRRNGLWPVMGLRPGGLRSNGRGVRKRGSTGQRLGWLAASLRCAQRLAWAKAGKMRAQRGG